MFSLEYQHVFKSSFCFVLLYSQSLHDWFIVEHCSLFIVHCFPRLGPGIGNIEILWKQNHHCSPGDQSLSVRYNLSLDYKFLREISFVVHVHALICAR